MSQEVQVSEDLLPSAACGLAPAEVLRRFSLRESQKAAALCGMWPGSYRSAAAFFAQGVSWLAWRPWLCAFSDGGVRDFTSSRKSHEVLPKILQIRFMSGRPWQVHDG